MHDVQIILGLLVAVAALAWMASRLGIAYPIFLVLGGLVLGFINGLPRVTLQPDVVFLLFLPPLLYYAALEINWRDFKENIRPISFLAVGLVLFTMTMVAAAAHHWIGLSWPTAFALGAIISPPDAVAATAVTRRLSVPRRITALLEGESLVNDATALVAYRAAVGAAVGAAFSPWVETGRFLLVAAGGVAVGYVIGIVVAWIRPRIREQSVEGVLSLLTPFIAYLPAEHIGVSGVLAVVTTGVYVSRRLPSITSARVRLRAYAVWDAVVFLLNGLAFILIGLQLPIILKSLADIPPARLVGYAAIISVTAIVARLACVLPATYLPRWISKKFRRLHPVPPLPHVFIVGWTGMRGIVSLAAALALPEMAGNVEFPDRAMIQFLTFGVILATLVLQGLTLAPLIRWLNVREDGTADVEETTARYLVALAAVERLDKLAEVCQPGSEIIARLRARYDERIERYSQLLDGGTRGEPALGPHPEERAMRETIAAERRMILRLRDDGVVSDEVMRKLQEELDLEETRLPSYDSVSA